MVLDSLIMKRLFVGFVGLCLVANAAFAFEQSGSKGVTAPPAGKALDLQTTVGPSKPGAGSEIRIPGLGALGVLPKLDFGLELLYGEGRPDSVVPREDDAAADNDGLQIKGTLKHRF